MKNIEALIDDGGDITVGAIGPIECAATAADGHNALAMLVRREGETLNALLRRLDRAIARYYDTGETTDEINPPSEQYGRRQDGAAGRSRFSSSKGRWLGRL